MDDAIEEIQELDFRKVEPERRMGVVKGVLHWRIHASSIVNQSEPCSSAIFQEDSINRAYRHRNQDAFVQGALLLREEGEELSDVLKIRSINIVLGSGFFLDSHPFS